MSHMPFFESQLEWMIEMVRHRPDWLNPILLFLNYFDTVYFAFALIPVIWLGVSYRWGLRIFYWMTLSNFMMHSAKIFFGWPRPSTVLPELGLFHPKSNGFPSGGAMTAMFLGFLLIYYTRKRWSWILGVSYILIISASRVFLGVHYPLDVLGGWVLALILVAPFIYLKEPIDRFLASVGIKAALILSLAIPIFVMIISPIPRVQYIMSSCLGIGIGTYLSLRYKLFLKDAQSLKEGSTRALSGVLLIVLIFFLLPFKLIPAQSFLVALFMSAAASPIHRFLKIT